MFYVLNWKMLIPNNIDEYMNKLNIIQNKLYLAVPYPYLPILISRTNHHIGVQDVSAFRNGAYSGQVSAQMVRDFNATFTFIHHCETLPLTKKMIQAKIERAIENDLTIFYCFGEDNVNHQVKQCKEQLSYLDPYLPSHNIVLCYEPISSVGTGSIASYEHIMSMIDYIKKHKTYAQLKLCYGGSVNTTNIHDIQSLNVDGLLIGSASLNIDQLSHLIS